MSTLVNPSQMSNKDKFKALLKQVAVSAAMNAVPGSVQFIAEVGQRAYELWGASPSEERHAYRQGSAELSEAELDQATAELAQETGVNDRAVVDMMVQSVRGMRGLGEDEALRSINASLHRATNGQATINPQRRRRLSPSAVGTMMGAPSRRVDVSGRGGWPQVTGFEISGVLGRGAAGTVYLAKQESEGGRVCALKVGELESPTRFEREVRAMGAVDHPNLIDLWGSGQLSEPPPRYWIAMPNVGGLTLADLWRQALPLPDRLRLMGEVLAGLVALHRAGLVHRDLKPANALVTPTLSVRLADFGLSKDAVKAGEATMTATSIGLEGTPAYMSPEQVNEERSSGPEVDVWAFGVMLYETLRGERPFGGQNIMRLGMEILTKSIDIEGEWAPDELKPILRKTLSRDKSDRFASALEIERPYREGVGVIIDRFAHNDLRDAWDEAERATLFFEVTSLGDLGAEGWRGALAEAHAERLSEGLGEVRQWRSSLSATEARVRELESSLGELEVSQMERSVEVAHAALRMSEGLDVQWRAWHEGLCELERAGEAQRAQLEGARLRARGEAGLKAKLHQSLTAWGRAGYEEREQQDRRARQMVRDLRAELERKVHEVERRGETLSVGASREAEYNEQYIQGEREGREEARRWAEEASARVGADEAGRSRRDRELDEARGRARQAWARLGSSGVADHDRAGEAWRWALDEGRLARFCLDQALTPNERLLETIESTLPRLSSVDPKRVAEVCTVGLEASAPAATRASQAEALTRRFELIETERSAWVSALVERRLTGRAGVARLEEAGRVLGVERGAREALAEVERGARGWRAEEVERVSQRLREALRGDLQALEEIQRARKAQRRKWILVGAVLIALLVIVGVSVERERREAAERVERERREAVERVERIERERREAVERVEQQRREAAERVERERREAAERVEQQRREAAELARCATDKRCNLSGIDFIKIPGGSFKMGSKKGDSDEKPVRRVTIKSFLMSKTEVTVGQYRKCVEVGTCSPPNTGTYCNWDKSDRKDHPINCVDWNQARAFAKWAGGDLPSEAEWEYAARGGQRFTYAGSNDPDEVAWYSSNSGGGTKPVGGKKKNEFGLYDMSGNVWEWVLDEHKDSYSGAPRDGTAVCKSPTCRQGAPRRVRRGGCWSVVAGYPLRVANRIYNSPDGRLIILGFRLRRTLP